MHRRDDADPWTWRVDSANFRAQWPGAVKMTARSVSEGWPAAARVVPIIAIFAIVFLHDAAHAAGFGIDYEGALAVGTATAGSAAARDASTIFYNPAGLGFLDRNEFIAGGNLFLLHDRFQNDGSTILDGASPTPGTDGRDAIPPTPVPWLYASYRLSPEWSVGVGVFAPFGLETDYGSGFVGRYQNQVTSLTAIDTNPSISYRPFPWLSLGAGVDIQYVHVRLTQAIDFGSACAAALGTGPCARAFGLVPGQSDGAVDNHGDSLGFGLNLGVIAEPVPGTRLGVAWRSGIDQHFGSAQQSFVVEPGARGFLTAAGAPLALTGSRISTSIPLPGRLTFGVKQTLSERVDLLLDATLTYWGVFSTTSIAARNQATGSSVVIQQGYRNAWRFATGLEYKVNEQWRLRAGAAYDETPIPPSAVQAALPDRDRVYISVGGSVRIGNGWNFDAGYSHVVYVGDIPIERTNSAGNTLSGAFMVGGDIVAAQLRVEY
jgi:long-chain fatty acid transport protein